MTTQHIFRAKTLAELQELRTDLYEAVKTALVKIGEEIRSQLEVSNNTPNNWRPYGFQWERLSPGHKWEEMVFFEQHPREERNRLELRFEYFFDSPSGYDHHVAEVSAIVRKILQAETKAEECNTMFGYYQAYSASFLCICWLKK